MKLLFISDLFKGTLSSERITQFLEAAARRAFPGCETAGMPAAGSGGGTIDAMISALNGIYHRLAVRGPSTEEAQSSYGELERDPAIVEMTVASGLPVVLADRHNPSSTTTCGTGELVRDAPGWGYWKISIAIGSGATDDGSMEAICALGIRFLGDQGNELEGRGRDLTRVTNIDVSRIYPMVAQARFTVIYDVTNPLTGPDGVTYTLGKQKGGTSEILDVLGGGMVRYAALLKEKLGVNVGRVPGMSVVSGLRAALCVLLKANLRSGIDAILDLVHFDNLLKGVGLMITGEGRMGQQSAFGKVPNGVGKRYRERGILVAVIVGGVGNKAETIFDCSIDSIMTTINDAMDIGEALERAEELYISATDRIFGMLKAGMSLGREQAEADVAQGCCL